MKTIVVTLLVILASGLFFDRGALAQDARLQDMNRHITAAEQAQKSDQHRQAADEYRKARLVAAQIFGHDHIYVASLYQAEGIMLRELAEHGEAEKLVQQTLRISEAVKDREMTAEAANNLAAIRWDLGRYLDALAMHEKAFEMFRQMYGESSPTLAISRGNLAGVYKSLGQEAQAESLYAQSLVVLERNSGQQAHALANTLMNFADLYAQRGDLSRAELLLLRSIQIKSRTFGPTHFEVSRTQNNLAALYATMGQYSKAEKLHLENIQNLEAALGPNHVDVGRSLLNLANVYHSQKKYDKSEPLYRRSVEIRQNALPDDHPDVALAKHMLAGAYCDTEEFAKAHALFGQARSARENRFGKDHPIVAASLMSEAMLALLEKRYADAEAIYNQALAIRQAKLNQDHPDMAYTHTGLGRALAAQESYQESASHFDLARRGFRKYVCQVLPALSEADQLTFLRAVDAENYRSALSLIRKAPDDPQIHELSAGWVLNGKGISQQILAERAIMARSINDPLLATLAKSLLAVRKQLASLSLVDNQSEDAQGRNKRIATLAEQERNQAAQLARLGGRPAADNWVELATVRDSLPPNSVLVEIARFAEYDYHDHHKADEEQSEHYVAWIIPPAGDAKVRAIQLGDARHIDEAVQAVRKAIAEAPQRLNDVGEEEAEVEIKQSLAALSALVLQPLMKASGSADRVYLSPDSLLWLVPWNALPLADGKYAIEKYDFRFMISGRDRLKPASKTKPGRPIMFADPNYDMKPAEVQEATQRLLQTAAPRRTTTSAATSGTFKLGAAGRLPGTKAEAEAVRPQLEAWAGDTAYVYSDQWALEAVFKRLQQPKVLVLSTHGFFKSDSTAERKDATAPSNPLLQCGLLLAGCNHPAEAISDDAEDGILTGLEIVNADLRGTDLVVLSACETGLGEVRTGEGVAGLRQAFQLAGARAVVSTLWQIPDRETAKLMTSFFTNLAEDDDKAAALRAAQLQLIKSRQDRNGAAHPFFWAAFTITGE